MKKTFLILISSASFMFSQSAGSSGLSFLKMGFGARNIALADAGNSLSNDVTSLFYNPSKLAGERETEITLMHNEWIDDIRSEQLGIKFNLAGINFAAGFNLTTISDIEIRDKAGEALSTFSANYFFGSLSSGFYLSEKLKAGASIAFIHEGLYTDEASGIGFGLGVNYLMNDNLEFSASARNLGSMSALKNESTILPSELRIGGSYKYKLSSQFNFTAGLDAQKYLKTDDIHLLAAAEIVYDNIIALRGGYASGYISKDFTGGVGLYWGGLKIDYALSPFYFGLGTGHVFSLGIKF